MAVSTTDLGREAGVLLHESLPEAAGRGTGSRWLSGCVEVITCRHPADIVTSFARIDAAVDTGFSIAGGFSYELGYHLEPKLRPLAIDPAGPLLQVGVFQENTKLTADEASALVRKRAGDEQGDETTVDGVRLRYGETRASYIEKVQRVLDYIHAGDIYQANFTFPARFEWQNGIWSLYERLMAEQQVSFGAVVDLPDLKAASLSPELFFRKSGSHIESRPMKGTAGRGANLDEDDAIAANLKADPKNRAENLMIVDLIRNDLGRLAKVGSVRVDELFEIERYRTVHQMVSHVSAEIDPATSLETIMRRIFPCGSVTGAPKIRAMEIIAELESSSRGLYTGALGYVTPERDMAFSVPIRTVELLPGGQAVMGIGSGVVADSSAEAEYDECLLKAQFLQRALSTIDVDTDADVVGGGSR